MPKHKTITRHDVDRYHELQELKWRKRRLAESILENMAANLPVGTEPSDKMIKSMIEASKKVANKIIEAQKSEIMKGG